MKFCRKHNINIIIPKERASKCYKRFGLYKCIQFSLLHNNTFICMIFWCVYNSCGYHVHDDFILIMILMLRFLIPFFFLNKQFSVRQSINNICWFCLYMGIQLYWWNFYTPLQPMLPRGWQVQWGVFIKIWQHQYGDCMCQ